LDRSSVLPVGLRRGILCLSAQAFSCERSGWQMNQRTRLSAVVLAMALVAACNDSPTAPAGPFVGTWAGAIVDSAAGSGTARLVLTQSGAGVSGTFTTTFANSALDRAGTVSGTATANAASVFLTPSAPLSCGLSGTLGTT